MSIEKGTNAALGLTAFIMWFVFLAAWITHIVYCLEHNRWGFLIAGALAFPIAIVHGVIIWIST